MGKSSDMHTFIQTLYGVIIGVSFFNFGTDNMEAVVIEDRMLLFNFSFFLLTFIIATHDWFEYHKGFRIEEVRFVPYLPQIGAVLMMGLMFNSCTIARMKFWFLAAVVYTIFNWINLKKASKTDININKKELRVVYTLHLLLSALFFSLLHTYDKPDKSTSENIPGLNWLLLVLTAVIVIGIWIYRARKEKHPLPSKAKERVLEIRRLYPFNSKNSFGIMQSDDDTRQVIIKLKVIELIGRDRDKFVKADELEKYFTHLTKNAALIALFKSAIKEVDLTTLEGQKTDLIKQLLGFGSEKA